MKITPNKNNCYNKILICPCLKCKIIRHNYQNIIEMLNNKNKGAEIILEKLRQTLDENPPS